MTDTTISSREEAKVLGSTTYFTGVPCKHGHLSPRQTSNGTCIECRDTVHREVALESKRRWNKRTAKQKKAEERHGPDRHKHAARNLVAVSVHRGKLKRQPCERCGQTNSQAHHEDYSKPLDVMWLCPIHHRERHRELAAEGKHP